MRINQVSCVNSHRPPSAADSYLGLFAFVVSHEIYIKRVGRGVSLHVTRNVISQLLLRKHRQFNIRYQRTRAPLVPIGEFRVSLATLWQKKPPEVGRGNALNARDRGNYPRRLRRHMRSLPTIPTRTFLSHHNFHSY
jgi:hypothetical protein